MRMTLACERCIRGEDRCREVLLWGNNNIIDSGTLNTPPVAVSSYPCGSVAAFVVFTIAALCWHVILSRSLFLTFSSAAREDVSVEKSVTSRHIRVSLNCSPALCFKALTLSPNYTLLLDYHPEWTQNIFQQLTIHATAQNSNESKQSKAFKTHSCSEIRTEFLPLLSPFLSLLSPWHPFLACFLSPTSPMWHWWYVWVRGLEIFMHTRTHMHMHSLQSSSWSLRQY